MPVIDLGSVVGPQGPQGATGATGATGAPGAAGPNQVTSSTNTTLNGVLQGNGSKVSALASDAKPTEGSNNLIRSGTAFTALQSKSNKNFLRNWYWVGGGSSRGVFPVNQRGASSYSGRIYCIDGWVLDSTASSIALQSDCLRVVDVLNANSAIDQYDVMPISALTGQTITLSALCKGVVRINCKAGSELAHRLTVDTEGAWDVVSMTVDYGQATADAPLGVWINASPGGGDVYVKAMKLEYGSVQTLAQKINGVWVLTDTPDWEEERIACETAYYSWADGTAAYKDTDIGNLTAAMAEMIAPVEYGNNASRAYSTGKVFCWRGHLWKAKTSIGSGAAFTIGTNCEQTTLAAMLSL